MSEDDGFSQPGSKVTGSVCFLHQTCYLMLYFYLCKGLKDLSPHSTQVYCELYIRVKSHSLSLFSANSPCCQLTGGLVNYILENINLVAE